MEDTIITFETAKLAKEKGFNLDCRFTFAVDTVNKQDKPDEDDSFNLNGEPVFTELDLISAQDCGYTAYFRPTQSLLQKWLRENHAVDVTVQTNYSQLRDSKRSYNVHLIYDVYDRYHLDENNKVAYYPTYEEALEAGLQEALKLVPNEL